MKTNKILFGGIAGGISFFLLGWLIYGVILMEYTSANYNQCSARATDDMVWWAMLLSNFAYAFLIAVIYFWTNSKGVVSGIKISAIVGLLISIAMDLSIYSMSTMFSGFCNVLVDIVAYTIYTILGGIIISLVMSFEKK